MTWLEFCRIFLLALIALGIVSVAALVVILCWTRHERKKWDRLFGEQMQIHVAETMMAYRKREGKK